jgi:hypothetical protein
VEAREFFEYDICVSYALSKDGTDFCDTVAHGNFIKELKKAAPDLPIVSNNAKNTSYSDLTLFPKHGEPFKQQLTVIMEDYHNGSKVTICDTV